MPGAGKSTVGVLLAKEIGLNFVDSDLLIQVRYGATLQEIMDARGHLELRRLEEAVLMDMPLQQTLVATGGSVVYSAAVMARLADAGPVVFLDVPLDALLERVDNLDTRGIARGPGQNFTDVYRERQPLYERYADIRVDAHSQSPQETARLIASLLRE